MARKHCTQHSRSKSNYPGRLQKRGLTSASVRMEPLETLRKRQGYYRDDSLATAYNIHELIAAGANNDD